MSGTIINSLTCSTEYVTGKLCVTYTPQSYSYYSLINITLEEYDFLFIKQIKLGQRASVQNKHYFTFTDNELEVIHSRFVLNNGQGRIRATIRTYSDSSYTKEVGSASQKSIKLSLSGLPMVNLTLTPVNSGVSENFNDIYIQGISRVKCKIAYELQNGATLLGIDFRINNVLVNKDKYDTEYTTNILQSPGNVYIAGIVVDSRSNSKADELKIYVEPYSRPSVVVTKCERCDENKEFDQSGKYLHIKAKRVFNKLKVNGEQRNFCKLEYVCYNADGSPKQSGSLLERTNPSDEIDVILDNVVDDTKKSYFIDIKASDDVVGTTDAKRAIIPSEEVSFNLVGNKICIGGYASKDKTFEIVEGWKLYLRNNYVTGFVVEDGVYKVTMFNDNSNSAVSPDPENGESWPANTWHYKIWNNGQYLMFGNFALACTNFETITEGALHKTAEWLKIETPFLINSGYITGSSASVDCWIVNSGLTEVKLKDTTDNATDDTKYNAIQIKNMFADTPGTQNMIFTMRLVVTGFIK